LVHIALSRNRFTETGNKVLYLSNPVWSGEWKLEWTRVGQGERALFLLQPGSAYYETRKKKNSVGST
jgi:hypothetical protein